MRRATKVLLSCFAVVACNNDCVGADDGVVGSNVIFDPVLSVDPLEEVEVVIPVPAVQTKSNGRISSNGKVAKEMVEDVLVVSAGYSDNATTAPPPNVNFDGSEVKGKGAKVSVSDG
jgi:hypothetical protein